MRERILESAMRVVRVTRGSVLFTLCSTEVADSAEVQPWHAPGCLLGDQQPCP